MKLRGPIPFKIMLTIFGIYVVFGALTQCASFNMSEKALKKEFANSPLKPAFYTYKAHNRTMMYAKIGNDSLPMVIFVHGSPGGWNAYIDYFKDTALTNHACLVSVDRAGYGGSGDGDAEPSLEMQAALLAPILQTTQSNKKPILVGHSLGGPIIARMAMDYPNQIGSLIFLAPSIDPLMEKNEWYRHIFKLGIIQAVEPGFLVASNLELMPLKKELELMLPLWQNIRIPCTILHGKKDMFVPYGNVAFYEKMLVNAPKKEVVSFENENHFIPDSQYDTVKMKILEHLRH
jgi:pimeloyl-ACP methyl ester carboxylesterase